MMFCCAHIITNSNANTNSTTHVYQKCCKPLIHSEIKILKIFRVSKEGRKSVKLLYTTVKRLYTFRLFQAKCLHLLVECRAADFKDFRSLFKIVPGFLQCLFYLAFLFRIIFEAENLFFPWDCL